MSSTPNSLQNLESRIIHTFVSKYSIDTNIATSTRKLNIIFSSPVDKATVKIPSIDFIYQETVNGNSTIYIHVNNIYIIGCRFVNKSTADEFYAAISAHM